MKRLIAVACALLCQLCANEDGMCDAISGKSPLCVITATMPCSKKLSDESIKTIFDVQHLLFERHEEYMPGLLGGYNWWSTEVQNALDKLYREFETLAIIRNTPKLIVFSENFFGRKIVRQKQEFETLLKHHTSRFEDTIFAVNYLCAEQTDVPIAEVDRTINIIQSSCEFYNFIDNIYSYDEKLNVLQKFLLQEVVKNIKMLTNKLSSHYNTGFESHTGATAYIKYLKSIIQKAKTEYICIQTLENITYYLYRNKILMKYNKSTYCNEISNLEESGYIYKFGYGIDLIQNDNKIANILHDNVSTEICKDVIVKARKDDKKRRIHIVQSDYINLNQYFDHLPKHEILVHADSYNSCLYIGRQAQPQSFEYTIKYRSVYCAIKCFMLE